MEILHFKDLGDTSVSECSLCVNLVIDNFIYVVSDTSPLYKIEILHIEDLGIQVSSANAAWVLI